MTLNPIILLLMLCLPVCLLYDTSQCPSPWEWRLRGKVFCNSSKDYSCLLNEIKIEYEESCRFKAHELNVGEEFVIRQYPEGELCRNNDRYQPYQLQLLQTDCIFVRSKCEEPGQVIYHSGNESTDIKCRCNFKEGWAFVSKPNSSCFCLPSEDDCTCYTKKCPPGYALTPDYECARKTHLSYMLFFCPDMNPQRISSNEKPFMRLKHIIDESMKDTTGQRHRLFLIGPSITLIIGIAYIVLAGFLFFLKKLPTCCYIQISPPTNLTCDTETERLILTWTKPRLKQVSIHQFKVLFTLDEWESQKIVLIDANGSSCVIPDVLPLKTYRFTITSCLKNSVEGKRSDEIIYKSPRPSRPQSLTAVGIHGNINLTWTFPVASVLRNDEYHIEISIDGKTVTETIKNISPDTLEYSIKNVKEDITYWFKIYSVCNLEKSPSTENSYFTGPSHQVTLPIKASVDITDLNNVNSNSHKDHVMALEAGVREEYQTVEGEQTISNPKFWTGSFFASFILVSKGFYDQKILQTVMENAVNKGTFGRFDVFKEGFYIKALNYPVPPKHVTTEINHRNVRVSWSEPTKTFFKTKGFMIQYTIDNWKKYNEITVPADQHHININVESPSNTLQVQIYTCMKSSIRSLPSYEVNVDLHAAEFEQLIATTRNTITTHYNATQTLFVETVAFKEIRKTLEAKQCVIIHGNPGDGKTTYAYRAMDFLTTIGKRPLEINMQSNCDWDRFTNSSKENMVILIDNVFGEYSVSSDSLSQWSYQSHVLKDALSHQDRNNYLIITIRSEIFRQCGYSLTSDNFFNSTIIDIALGSTFGLCDNEMKCIYRKYVPDGCFSSYKLPQRSDISKKLGFQQCCRLFMENRKLRETGNSFFTHPFPTLTSEFNTMLSNGDMDMAITVAILFYGGSVNIDTLSNTFRDRERKMEAMEICCIQDKNLDHFRAAIANIALSFIKNTKQSDKECLTFSHSSILSSVFIATGKHRPDKLISNCHYNLLSMVTTSQCSSIETESLEIPESCIAALSNRVRELLNGKSPSSCLFNVISDLHVWEDNRFFKEMLRFDDLLIHPIDENGLPMFVHFAAVGCLKLVKHLFKRVTRTSDLLLALKVACGANKLNIIDFMLQSGVIPNIECCFYAVKGGHIQVIRKLVDAGVDITEVCKSKTEWVTVTSVLEEAALQNQCQLIEPLLQLCKELITIKSSIGASAVHFVASAGDVSLLKKLINDHHFSPYAKSDVGSTILHFASQNNRFEAVKYIIETYPSLFLENYYCYEQGTILHTAAQSGNFDLFEYVFNKNIETLEAKSVDCIQLQRGCHITVNRKITTSVNRSTILHVRNYVGFSIMHQAAWSRCVQIVQFLVNNDVDVVGNVSNTGLSVLDFARLRKDNSEMVNFLQTHFF